MTNESRNGGYSSGDFPELQLPEKMGVRLPDSSVQSVVYLGQWRKGRFYHKGTGFLVAHRYPDIGEGQTVWFLVTADHVARSLGDSMAARLNNTTGQSTQVKPPKTIKWWRHPTDETVDAAVLPWIVNPNTYRYKLFETDGFLTQDKIQETDIGIGDEVYAVGLFTLAKGETRITPIVRVGHIAMMAGERLTTRNYGNALMHLVEARSLHGLSGSPVFARETFPYPFLIAPNQVRYGRITGEIYFLGLVHGYWVAEDGDIGSDVHSGISMVVPAWQIKEIIEQEQLVADITKRINGAAPIESSLDTELIEDTEPTPNNRDIVIPPIGRKQFFGALEKATQRRKRKPS